MIDSIDRCVALIATHYYDDYCVNHWTKAKVSSPEFYNFVTFMFINKLY